ncbi:MAG: serine/threonine protein kinase [Paenibacillaceae bacterium]|nr:serine/threonine protein kinase [Paenibacillaceae bacterium]
MGSCVITSSNDRPVSLAPGSVVRGKWNKARYQIERLLGEGANGKVYLVRHGGVSYALKIGFDTVDLQSEVNMLKTLSRLPGSFSRYLFDVDDLAAGSVRDGKEYPFYVMRYVQGEQLGDFVRRQGADWIGLIGAGLLRKLRELHRHGFVFGDLKLDNILVGAYGAVELIDFGGVTPKGSAVKQFTEVNDRGYWGAGGRSADEAYDLFAYAIVLMQLLGKSKERFFKQPILPQNRSPEWLQEEVAADPAFGVYAPFVRKALAGGYATSEEAYRDWRSIVHAGMMPKRKKESGSFWLKAGFVASVALFALALYAYWPYG